LFLYGVSGSVYFRFVVPFCIICGASQHSLWCSLVLVCVCCQGSAGREISKEEDKPLMPSSTGSSSGRESEGEAFTRYLGECPRRHKRLAVKLKVDAECRLLV